MYSLFFYGIEGERLESLEVDRVQKKKKIRTFGPDVILVQSGGNNISLKDVRPEVFAGRLIEWVKSLTSQFRFTSIVIISELLIRSKLRHASAEV